MLEQFPKDYLHQNPDAALLYVRALRCLKNFESAVDWVSQHRQDVAFAQVMLECSACLNGLGRYEDARDLLQQIIPNLNDEDLGIAWARLGYALFNLKEPWEDAYKNAVPLLEGEEIGRCLLNYGYCLSMSGQPLDARQVWLKALVCFKDNPYFLAWIRNNLATIALNENEPEAERHLLAALEQTHHPKAESLKAGVWNGLGRFRSQLGEWSRAEFAFLEALRLKADPHHRRLAYHGLSRTQYLSGRLIEALETLETALHEPDLEHQMLYIAQAKVYLKQGQPARAKASLEKAGKPQHELEEWPWRIASAELARQEGQSDEALKLLEGLPISTLHSREEVRQWPQLFDLLRGAGREVPQPLEYTGQTVVEVRARGALHVSVNGRSVPLAPAGRAGELLVLLLENNKQASSEKLVEMLWPGSAASEKRQALWQLTNEVRHALGWADSLRSLRKAYELDKTAKWHYDVAEARASKKVEGAFLEGVYSDWATEIDQELEGLRA